MRKRPIKLAKLHSAGLTVVKASKRDVKEVLTGRMGINSSLPLPTRHPLGPIARKAREELNRASYFAINAAQSGQALARHRYSDEKLASRLEMDHLRG